jgi:hypothetical protein
MDLVGEPPRTGPRVGKGDAELQKLVKKASIEEQ